MFAGEVRNSRLSLSGRRVRAPALANCPRTTNSAASNYDFARPGSRRLFRTTARSFGQTNDDVAVAFARAAHLAEPIDDLPIERDPDQAVGTRARRRV
jgi:hypothetical protein